MTPNRSARNCQARARSGFALFYCVLVIALVSVVVLGVLETEATQVREVSHRIEHERAILLAEAGLADALSRLELSPTFSGIIRKTQFPLRSGRYYTVIVSAGLDGATIASTGVSGESTYTKTITVKLSP